MWNLSGKNQSPTKRIVSFSWGFSLLCYFFWRVQVHPNLGYNNFNLNLHNGCLWRSSQHTQQIDVMPLSQLFQCKLSHSGPIFTKKTTFHWYRDSHHKSKTVIRPSRVKHGDARNPKYGVFLWIEIQKNMAKNRSFESGTGEFPAQMASYAENVSIWWRHHVSIQFLVCRRYSYHIFLFYCLT